MEIEQIFFFDPDGNVIELSNCGPPPGMITCNSRMNNNNSNNIISSVVHNHLSSSPSGVDMKDRNSNATEDTASTQSEPSSLSSPSSYDNNNTKSNNPASTELSSMFLF